MRGKTTLKHRLEAAPVLLFLKALKPLPFGVASSFGSFLGRLIGPHLKWHRIAKHNLEYALPISETPKHKKILTGMWDNLGRVFAEYSQFSNPDLLDHIEIDEDSIRTYEEAIARGPIIFASAHLANWEVTILTAAKMNIPLTAVYRHLNNPVIDKVMYKLREPFVDQLVPKGKKAAVAVIKTLKAGKAVGLLIDQKMNDGLSIPFFAKPAMTAPAVAELALKYNAQILTVHIQRKDKTKFAVTITPMALADGDDTQTSVKNTLLSLHQRLESWILEHPEQWLWVHQRWGKIGELSARTR